MLKIQYINLQFPENFLIQSVKDGSPFVFLPSDTFSRMVLILIDLAACIRDSFYPTFFSELRRICK